MRRVLLALALAACGPEPRDPEPGVVLPEGVWQPVAEPGFSPPLVVRSPEGLWFGYTRDTGPVGYDAYLALTTTDGDTLVEPTSIATGASVVGLAPVGDGVAVALVRERIPTIDVAIHDDQAIRVAGPHTLEGTDSALGQLLAAPDGTLRWVGRTSVANAEVVSTMLDTEGHATGTTVRLGTPEDMSFTATVSAAVAADGTTLIAWDRAFDECYARRPSSTLTAAVASTNTVGPTQSVLDLGGMSERGPEVATVDGTSYVSRSTDFVSRRQLGLARFDAPGVVIADLGPIRSFDAQHLALSAPGRGAVAWNADGLLSIRAFVDNGSSVRLDAPHVFAVVSDAPVQVHFAELVAVDTDRYVMVWTETTIGVTDPTSRMFARTIDIRMPPPPPPPAPPTSPRPVSPVPPCIH